MPAAPNERAQIKRRNQLMAESRKGGGSRVALMLVLGLLLSVVNLAILIRIVTGDWSVLQALPQSSAAAGEVVKAQFQTNGATVIYLLASPLLLSLIAALLAGASSTPTTAATSTPSVEPKKPGEEALRLLRALQEEARFIDFIQEDID